MIDPTLKMAQATIDTLASTNLGGNSLPWPGETPKDGTSRTQNINLEATLNSIDVEPLERSFRYWDEGSTQHDVPGFSVKMHFETFDDAGNAVNFSSSSFTYQFPLDIDSPGMPGWRREQTIKRIKDLYSFVDAYGFEATGDLIEDLKALNDHVATSSDMIQFRGRVYDGAAKADGKQKRDYYMTAAPLA